MRLFHSRWHVLSVAAVLAAVGAACSTTAGSSPGGDGTTTIQTSQARAAITGQVDSSVGSDGVQLAVDGQAQSMAVAPDGTFVVRDVPTGDVNLSCQAAGLTGTLTISNVQPGEIIQITLKREGDALVIVIEQRTPASQPPSEVTRTDGDALVIHESHVCYWLKPGHYERDIVVDGDDVHLFGAAHDSCVIDDFSILDGKLELDGQRDTVLDVELNGSLVIDGQHCSVQDTCTKCFDQGCEHACGNDDQHGKTCGPGGGEEDGGVMTPDAGTPTPDAGGPNPPDAGSPQPDAGGPLPDAGTAPDSGALDAGMTRDSGTVVDAGSSGSQDGGTTGTGTSSTRSIR